MLPALPRRRFLSLSLATAGAWFGPLGCASEDDAPEDTARAYFPQSVASGDPRPNSVILWTRLVDVGRSSEVLPLELELATDAEFRNPLSLNGATSLLLSAEPDFDHCVKARVDGLGPASDYYYRFRYRQANGDVLSHVGRTRTAPEEGADVPVRFGVVCCQSYDGRYYHVYRRLLAEPLDFILHLGDYVYETADAVPGPAGARRVRFRREFEALVLSPGEALAAQSLDNYRDLYRSARSDPDLQAAHERFAFIIAADDHEFSDDCHGETATYFSGQRDERDPERRAAADQAFFEYQPIDYETNTGSAWDAQRSFPENLRIYRRFGFGQHLDLVVTDLRRYRPDHLIPEDALPGAMCADQASLAAVESAVELVQFAQVGGFADGAYQALLQAHATELAILPGAVTGAISVPWINQQLLALQEAGVSDVPDPIEPSAEFELGLSFQQLGKSEHFSRLGSRYLVAEAPFHAYAAARFAATQGASENLLGNEQREWFLSRFRASDKTFKVWGSEVALLSRALDLSGQAALPEQLRTRLLISADDWDGFPNEREALLGELSALDNVVVLSGDLHCFFAGTPYLKDQPERCVVEFLTSSVSSTTWLAALSEVVATQPNLPPGTGFLLASVGQLLQDPTTRPNPHLAFADVVKNGASVVRVAADALDVELLLLAPEDVVRPAAQLTGPLSARFGSEKFRVRAGEKELAREVDGVYRRWDVASAGWA